VARILTLGFVGAIVATNVAVWPQVVAQWGSDYGFYRGAASRWWETGQFYLTHQLTGPYEATSGIDTLYPPFALGLFAPFVWLPAVLWWAIPLGILAWHVATSRPAWWAWPLLALLVWWPRSQSIVIWGNTSMWLAATVALGLRFGWPAALVLLKPSLAPFALLGIRSRGWWLTLAVLVVVSVPMAADYIAALRNNVGGWPPPWYSLADVPLLLVPVVATWARESRTRWSVALPRRSPPPSPFARPWTR
jgi:hypothetical protein